MPFASTILKAPSRASTVHGAGNRLIGEKLAEALRAKKLQSRPSLLNPNQLLIVAALTCADRLELSSVISTPRHN